MSTYRVKQTWQIKTVMSAEDLVGGQKPLLIS